MIHAHPPRDTSPAILCVTPNPCVDRTIFVGRNTHPLEQSGGKGNNVARMINALGGTAHALTIEGGMTGNRLRELLSQEGINATLVPVEGAVRTVTTYVDTPSLAQRVEFEPGPTLSEEECDAFDDAYRQLLPRAWMVAIGGSAPCESLAARYGRWIEWAHDKGIPVLLDTHGAALPYGLQAKPDFWKPNEHELFELATGFLPGQELEAARAAVQTGIGTVLVSLGSRGAMLVNDAVSLHHPGYPVRVVNTVGAGDSFVGGFLYALAQGLALPAALCLACAAGAANVAMWRAAWAGQNMVQRLVSLDIAPTALI